MADSSSAPSNGSAEWRSDAALLIGLVLCKALAEWAILKSGFSAISDDDYARVVIAQRFAEHPSWDPSGTSWLPFPFWISGGAMLLFGPSLATARAVVFVTSLLSAAIIYFAARWLGLERRVALLGGLAVSLLPHSLWLGVATVPEGYTAALSLLAAASLVGSSSKRRWLGAAALLACTLSRYETWPLAAGFIGVTIDDMLKRRLPFGAIGCLALAGAGPVGWICQGWLTHGDPIFFLTRVSAYRRALDAISTQTSDASPLTHLLHYPLLMLRGEPELTAVMLLGAFFLWRSELKLAGEYSRPLGLAALQIAFLVAGDLRDGAPTHHPERPLLFIWLLAGLVATDVVCALLASTSLRGRFVRIVAPLIVLIVSARPKITLRDPFIDRKKEIAIGQEAALAIDPGSGVVAVDSDDYGYFAILAAFQRPSQTAILRSHDPREQRDPLLPVALDALRGDLERLHARWLIIDRKHQDLVQTLGSIQIQSSDFLVVALREAPKA